MISIIICSINKQKFDQTSDSIKNTIGAEYEIIRIDNSIKNWGICKAYNYGAKEAKGDYLCFMHEDIIFKSQGWGDELIKFVDITVNCGVIGFAGSNYVSRFHAFWWYNGKIVRNYFTPASKDKSLLIHKKTHDTERYIPTVVLDGLFLFCSRSTWASSPFDEDTFTHFHFYDMDFSLSKFNEGLTNYVCNTIDLVHLSSGTLARDHFDNAILFRNKYRHLLPLIPQNYGYFRTLFNELTSSFRLLLYARKVGVPKESILREIKACNTFIYVLLILGLPLFHLIRKVKYISYNNLFVNK